MSTRPKTQAPIIRDQVLLWVRRPVPTRWAPLRPRKSGEGILDRGTEASWNQATAPPTTPRFPGPWASLFPV